MEDFILREIDRLGEMLLIIARKLGLQEDVMPDYSLLDVKDEFDKAVCQLIWMLYLNRRIQSGILWKLRRFQTTV